MRPLLPILIASAAFAAEPAALPPELVPDHQLPAVSLMPVGSVLTKVTIPSYDTGRRLRASLRAMELTVVDPQTLEAKNVRLDFFNPDRSARARVDLKFARFDQQKGTLDTREPVEMISEDFHASGAGGLSYVVEQSKGFLLGPVKTRFYAKPKQPASP